MTQMRYRNKDPRKTQKRLFRCPVCGEVAPATKRSGKTRPGHIKTMYCCQCREDRDFEQIE